MIQIIPIPALNDNYIWMILNSDRRQAVIVDPGIAKPVIDKFNTLNVQLVGILITHHHWDHTNGIEALLNYKEAPIYGPANITAVNHALKQGDQLFLEALNITFQMLEVPGHTLDHLAYLNHSAVFCGDTLFTAGCGRVFEGTFAQMYHSLQKLANLPLHTQIYCGHEYTAANLKFAQAVEPDNHHITQRLNDTLKVRSQNQPTVPATLAIELKTNPFLRCHLQEVQQSASEYSGENVSDPIKTFQIIRQWKDQF